MRAQTDNEDVFMRFAVYLLSLNGGNQRGGMTANTALNYCSLVKNHLATGQGVPLMKTDTPRWKRLAKSLKKSHVHERRECRPLRISHLRRGFQHDMASGDAETVNRWAAVVCGLHLLARPKELCLLMRSDLSFRDHPVPHAVIKLLPLKKGPEQKPVPILLAQGDGSASDAYLALRRLVAVDPVPDSWQPVTPLFRARGLPLSVPVITGWTQYAARRAGETSYLKLFTARSLRIGGATEYHAIGVNELTIKLLGRWSSDCARLYARASQGQVLELSRRLGSAPDDPALEQIFPEYVQTARR